MSSKAAFSNEILLEGFMQAPAGIAIFGVPDLRMKIANPFYLRMVDRQEDAVGTPLFDIFPGTRDVVEPLLNQVLSEGDPYHGHQVKTTLTRNGRIYTIYLDLTYQPLKDPDGEIEAIMVVVHEVTPMMVARRSLEESEAKFRLMVSKSPIPMAILRGHDLIIELANDAILNTIWERKWEDVRGRKLLEVFPELEQQPYPGLIHNVLHTGQAYSEKESLVYIKGKSYHYIDFEYTPLFSHEGHPSGVMVTAYDVSEKVRARRKIEESEERLRMVVDASGLGTWELNVKTGEFDYSEKYLTNFGEKERLSHRELLGFMHPDDLQLRKAAFQEALQTGVLHYVARLQWRDKSMHWIEAHGKVLYDEYGEPVKMIGTSRDITEERRYAQGIRKSEEKFRLLADSMPQFVWTGDVNGNLNYFNKAVYDYTGLGPEEVSELGWLHIVHPDDRVANAEAWLKSVKTGSNFLFEHRFRRNDGVYRWQLSRAIPQVDAQGNIQMWVGTSTDIHDQKTFAKELEEKVFERTRELKETNEVLEKANRDLEQFAYIASHDLQEPLRKIQTFSDILKRNIHDQVSVNKYFSKIDSSAQRMGDLIKSVLDYSRLPTDPSHLMLSDLNEVVENVKSDLELMIADRGAVVKSEILPAVPGMPLQLNQLFGNLISNGLKFCREKPCIRISSKSVSGAELQHVFKADPFKQYVQLFFRDNGIGFDAQYKEQIFTIFQRLHGMQQYSGTGIGLALCKKIVENHEGFITAESEPGRGSTFIIYLPA